jgi:NADPH:quinone reductase-like Zn-dependent oxidoreductase
VRAAGVNRADLLQRMGKYPPPPGASPILGLEVAGEVAALGDDVKRWQVGDRVTALLGGGAMFLNLALGGHAQLRCDFMHHEQACTMAAEGYARIAGRPGDTARRDRLRRHRSQPGAHA